MGKPKKYYAVLRGRNPGIYTAWFGAAGAEAQIRSYPGARYKGFPSLAEARQWMESPEQSRAAPGKKRSAASRESLEPAPGEIIIHTDGGCRGNPGPGGYGAVIVDGDRRTELSQGFRLTTNNRMELLACIEALDSLQPSSRVLLHSDSRYVVNGISKGWARKWRANNWMRNKNDAAVNADLWARLLDLCAAQKVRFNWVRGHAGNPENERCDALATGAADGSDHLEDSAYVRGQTTVPADPAGHRD